MAGGSSHQRAVAKAAKKNSVIPDLNEEPKPPAQAARSEQWFASLKGLKNKKAIAALLFVGVAIGQIIHVADLYQDARRLVEQHSEPLKIEETIEVIHEPWMYVVTPVNQSTQPIPMWLFFYLTVHNRGDRNIWISDYLVSAHTRDRNRWIQLTPPPQNALFYLLPEGGMGTLKRQEDLNYNAANGPIQRDGYLTGWMFFGTCIAENVDKLEFEFHDKEAKLHRLQAGVANGAFGGKLEQTTTATANLTGSHWFRPDSCRKSEGVFS